MFIICSEICKLATGTPSMQSQVPSRDELVQAERAFIFHSLTDSTHKTYDMGCKSYNEFCIQYPEHSVAFPTEESIGLWLTYLAKTKKFAFRTINTYFSGLKSSLEHRGISCQHLTDSFRIKALLTGIAHQIGLTPTRPPRLPLTADLFQTVLDKCSPQERKGPIKIS